VEASDGLAFSGPCHDTIHPGYANPARGASRRGQPSLVELALVKLDREGPARYLKVILVPPKGITMTPETKGTKALNLQVVAGHFDDIDSLASSPLGWDQEYEQIGRGPFRGQLIQLVLSQLQLGYVSWTPGVLQKGTPPKDTWIFGLPVKSKGTLHIRRRPVRSGELLTATARDDVGFAATGPTDMMVAAIPEHVIGRWMLVRRGENGMKPDLPPRHWAVTPAEMARRAKALFKLLDELTRQSKVGAPSSLVGHMEARIADIILDMIPSAEVIESYFNRAQIARKVLQIIRDSLDDPPTVTELCEQTKAKERTLFLSCVEAFGRPPSALLLELRLNAVHRALVHPEPTINVSVAASQFGFTQFGRFSSMYFKKFGELPSVTLAKARGS
jgi:AraC family ethanolamine operon transcriptional activator